MEVTVPLTGGLELRRSKRDSAPGSLLYCKNFEVDRYDGYTTTKGFVRYDGRHVLVDEGDYYRITCTDATQYSWTVGTIVDFFNSSGIICNFSSVLSGGNYIHTFVVRLISASLGLPPLVGATVSTQDISPEFMTVGAVARLETGYTPAQRETEINTLETVYNALVSKVPGGPYTKIGGVTVFRNKLYVVADYRTILISSGTLANIDPLEGDVVRKTSDSSVIGKIVQMTDIAGDWNAGTGFSYWVIDTAGYDDVSLSATNPIEIYRSSTAYAVANYSQDLTALMRAGILTCGYNNDIDYSTDDMGNSLSPTLNRWSRVTLGRALPYVGGQDGQEPQAYVRPGYVEDFDATPITTSTTTPDGFATTCSSNSAGWLDSVTGLGAPLAAGTGDSTDYVYNAAATVLLPDIYFGFDLSEIPNGATIKGIQVTIIRKSTVASQQQDEVVSFVGLTGPVANYAKSAAWGNTFTSNTYGSSTDTWGNPLQTSQVVGSGFKLRVQIRTLTGTPQAQIQKVQIAVTYVPQSTKAYIYDTVGATDLEEVTIIHHTIVDGAFDASNDAQGVLIVDGLVPDAEKTTLLGAGLQVRSGSGGGGNLICTTSGRDTPITLPDSASLKSAEKRYQFAEARPYASDDNEVLFITNGVEAGMMFDGTYGLPISTGLENDFEKPTHAAYWGNNLFLGYDTGSVQVSDTGSPLTYIGSGSAALEIGVGDFITGLMPLKGQALAVSTRNRIYAIYGRVAAEFDLQIISPVVGAVPYSAIDVGRPIFCDYQGISTVSETDQYGNFAAGRLSDSVSPWLDQRLQTDPNSLIRFIAALQNRANSQYRQFFADGWVLTGTLTEGGMQFTTQHLKTSTEDEDPGVKVLGLTSGVFDDGKEGAFFTIDNASKLETDALGLDYDERNRYVYKLGSGRTFDGQTMECSLISSYMHMNEPTRTKKFDRATFFAEGVYTDCYVNFGVAGDDLEYTQWNVYSDYPAWNFGGATDQQMNFRTASTTARPGPFGLIRTAEISADGYAMNFGITVSAEQLGNGKTPLRFQDVTVRFQPIDKTKA